MSERSVNHGASRRGQFTQPTYTEAPRTYGFFACVRFSLQPVGLLTRSVSDDGDD